MVDLIAVSAAVLITHTIHALRSR